MITEFNELWEKVREGGGCAEARFRALPGGKAESSPHSGKPYLFLEISELAEDGSASSWHSEGDFILELAGKDYAGLGGVELDYRKLRLYLGPSFEKEEATGEGKKQLREYGIEEGKGYWVGTAEEAYRLPPAGPGQKPGRRTNRVILVSTNPFEVKPAGELIPLYRHWSY